MVILGLDMGEKRIGVAKSDELGMFSHPVGSFMRTSDETLIRQINEYISEFGVEKVVVGLPRNLDGSCGFACEHILALVDTIKPHLHAALEVWDERLTTKEANRYMAKSSLSGKKKRRKVDELAAEIMLQNYLDCHRQK